MYAKVPNPRHALSSWQFRVKVLNIAVENQFERLADVSTPLWRFDYQEQLSYKYERNLLQLRKVSAKIQASFLHNILNEAGVICSLNPVVEAPETVEYRNKTHFQVGMGVDGNRKTVGIFIKGKIADEEPVVCVPPDRCLITRPAHKLLCARFQEFIRQHLLPACHTLNDGGFWRSVNIRSNRQGHLMLIAVVHPRNLTADQLSEVKEDVTHFFLNSSCSPQVNSLYFHACPLQFCYAGGGYRYELLGGEPFILERLFHYKFRISPESFFQTNTAAAEVLCNTIQMACELDSGTVLLDICCGTGVYSIVFSGIVKRSIGIDLCTQAIVDARANAARNRVENAVFIEGRAEEILPLVFEQNDLSGENTVAIVNPPRFGLMGECVMALRRCHSLRRLVFVSCYPFSKTFDNFFNLCRPPQGDYVGKPFLLKKVIPVDMFPQTEHCELVLLLER